MRGDMIATHPLRNNVLPQRQAEWRYVHVFFAVFPALNNRAMLPWKEERGGHAADRDLQYDLSQPGSPLSRRSDAHTMTPAGGH